MRGDGRARAITPLLVAAGSAVVARAVLAADRLGRLPGGSTRWRRTNHAGRTVSLVEGVALAAGTSAPLALLDPPAGLAVLGAAVAGGVDDLAGTTATKGLRGHLRALQRGEVTTGALKVAALTVGSAAAVWWSDRATAEGGAGRTGLGQAAHTLAGAALVAGSANLANLFDLRPGRALKVAALPATLLAAAGNPAAAAVTGAGLAVLPDDLRGRTMLGDTGANPLGAAVGMAAAQTLGTPGRLLALSAVTTLTLASERVSFSAVIDSHPLLRRLDQLGRPPAPPTPHEGSGIDRTSP